MAGVAGQRPGLGDPGDREQHRDRGARGQVPADEGGPGPAHRQPRRGRVSGQAPGEIGDEVLIAALSRAGPEHEPAARAAGQLPGAAGVTRGDRHHPRGRPADLDHHLAAAPDDVAAAQRHQLAGPQPRPDAEHHHRQRRGAFRRIALGGRDRGQLRPLRWRVRRRRLRARKRRRPLPRRAVRRFGEPVQRRPVGAPGATTPGPPGRPRRTPRSRHSPARNSRPAGTPRVSANRDSPRSAGAVTRPAGSMRKPAPAASSPAGTAMLEI